MSEREYDPIRLGTDPREAVCEHHGKMRERSPVFKKDDHIYAALDGIHIHQCPECSKEMFAVAGEPDADEAHAMKMLVARFVESKWDDLKTLFVDLGPGEMDEGLTGSNEVFFHEPPAKEDIPDYLLEDREWFIHSRTGDGEDGDSA